MNIHILTHDRVHHADEVFAYATLCMAFQGHNIRLTRTRDPEIYRTQAGSPGVFLLDIGGEYDPDARMFDHHQKEGAGFRNMETKEWPYATAGLVWKHYGAQAILAMHGELTEADVEEIMVAIDDTIIKIIDAVDCNVRLKSAGPSLSGIIASFNQNWFESEHEQDAGFELVANLAKVILQNYINRQVGKIRSRYQVRNSKTVMDGKVLVLNTCLPWSDIVMHELPDVALVVYPVTQGEDPSWQMRAAVNAGFQAPLRINMPKAWVGLEHDRLVQASGEATALFCHRNGYLCGAQTYEGIMNMARRVLDINETHAN